MSQEAAEQVADIPALAEADDNRPQPKFGNRRRQGNNAVAGVIFGQSPVPGQAVPPAPAASSSPAGSPDAGTKPAAAYVGSASRPTPSASAPPPPSAGPLQKETKAAAQMPALPTELLGAASLRATGEKVAPGPKEVPLAGLSQQRGSRSGAYEERVREDGSTLDLPPQQTSFYILPSAYRIVRELCDARGETYADMVIAAVDAAIKAGVLGDLIERRHVKQRPAGSRFPARRAGRRRTRPSIGRANNDEGSNLPIASAKPLLLPAMMTEEELAVLADVIAEYGAPSRNAVAAAALEWYVTLTDDQRAALASDDVYDTGAGI